MPNAKYPGWNRTLYWQYEQDDDHDREGKYLSGFRTDYWSTNSDMILVREVAMMQVMELITDKPNWHVDIFDDAIAAQWGKEALQVPNNHYWRTCSNFEEGDWKVGEDGVARAGSIKEPPGILDEDCVKWCTAELRAKAEHFKKTGVVPTLDSTFGVAKSDVLVPDGVQHSLRHGFLRVEAERASSGNMDGYETAGVRDIVDPSMYPLIFGHSRVVQDAPVGVADAIDKWAGTGEAIPGHLFTEWDKVNIGDEDDKAYWSKTYQWLPSNIKFTDAGVRFTSYINNLHPTKHGRMYETLEKLVDLALPLWDQCVARELSSLYHIDLHGAGRKERRIPASYCDDENQGNWIPDSVEEMMQRDIAAGKITAPPDPDEDSDFDETEFEEEMERRWWETRQFVQYYVGDYDPADFSINPAHALRNDFREEGLQIFVKMTTINLTPENATVGFVPDWKVEGLLNEHIVGAAVYLLDCENVAPIVINFRAMTSMYQEDNFDVTDRGWSWMQGGFGNYVTIGSGGSCLQTYGSVEMKRGRFLAWPNYLHQKWSEFKLEDAKRKGSCRFVSLFLVDPLTRIVSTADVPPQQGRWWAEKAFGSGRGDLPPEIAQMVVEKGLGSEGLKTAWERGDMGGGKLPVELLDLVREQVDEMKVLPLTEEEARRHQEAMMEERIKIETYARDRWDGVEYTF
ncbi:hypothetical protein QBC34DRAFT_436837 [Podospora aff. communis PSN243]|uniref:Uncharacterized protein n=1 Tax=Podospora aff. communis PSN243 TaxID=3040156 RepID=A0AAV9GV99_9PEZI|nr:hypothetical protein QBC34DRAFT_436837 [Podospora aff. communis PSN243]